MIKFTLDTREPFLVSHQQHKLLNLECIHSVLRPSYRWIKRAHEVGYQPKSKKRMLVLGAMNALRHTRVASVDGYKVLQPKYECATAKHSHKLLLQDVPCQSWDTDEHQTSTAQQKIKASYCKMQLQLKCNDCDVSQHTTQKHKRHGKAEAAP